MLLMKTTEWSKMKYLKDYHDGDRVNEIYMCKHKQSAVTKNGKPYESVILQDKTGTMDAKIWDPYSGGIDEFDALDFVEIHGDITVFNNVMQVNVKRVRKCHEGEYNPAEYLPMTPFNIDEMFARLKEIIGSVENTYCKQLLEYFFIKDADFAKQFCYSSAAKAVHHGFVGGLLHHTLSVAELCIFYCTRYPVLNRDLLLTAAICHDIGKTKELSPFPMNDYTDDGNLLGHIVIGSEMVSEAAKTIPGFPPVLLGELKHCILAHHGELEYGSPKKPALVEAMALNFADNTDAKMETFTELMNSTEETGWLGFNRMFESNVRATRME